MEAKKLFKLFSTFITIAALVSACGRGATATTVPEMLALPTPTSSPVPTLFPESFSTPTSQVLNTVINPFTRVKYQIDENGCIVIPSGGTAYGAWTVVGNPNQVNDINQAEVKDENGNSMGIYTNPLELPQLVQPGYRLCP